MSSTAARWAAWAGQSGRHGVATPSSTPPTGAAGPIRVEIYINQAWTDISTYVSYADRITVTRGRADESATAEPAKLSLTLFNRDGRFCDTLPTSPLYGLIGRNTPIRVSKTVQGSRFFRFVGEVVAWPQTFDITGIDVRVKLEAAGIKRRLSQGNTPLKSTMYRGITQAPTLANLLAYWPLEDVVGSSSFASPLTTGQPMIITGGTPTLASFTGFTCSSALPVLDTNSEFTGLVTSYPSTTTTQFRFLLAIPAAGSANNQVLLRNITTGSANDFDVYYTTGGNLNLAVFDINSNNILTAGPLAAGADGALLRVSLELTQNGPDINYALRSIAVGSSTAVSITGTLAANTVGTVTRMIVSPAGGTPNITLGHVTLQNAITSMTDLQQQLAAGSGETAGRRVQRLCAEEAISFHSVGDLDASASMGPQPIDTLVNVLQQCPDTDLGMIYEPVDDLGFGYRTLQSLYNQTPSLALDVAQHHLAEPLKPVPDDQKTLNDITVSRSGGSSGRAVLLTGAMSVLPPPLGVGRYDTGYTISLPDDTQLLNQAGWRVHVGTVNEARYPEVHLQLSHSSFATNYALTAQALTTDVGDRITIDNPPPQLPPDEISLLVQGYTETFDQFLHEITFTCSPESPYRIGILDDPVYGRADTDGSTLHADVDAVTGTILVDTTDPTTPLWILPAADPASFPFDISVGGEIMTVTSISGSSSPQTFTVTRSINGVVKSQKAGSDVRLAHPTIISL